MDFQLISQLMGGRWSIDPQMVNVLTDLLARVLSGKGNPEFLFQNSNEASIPLPLKTFVFSHRLVAFPSALAGNAQTPKDSTAVIPVRGILFKYGTRGNHGMAEIEAWIQAANNNPNISRVLYYVDSEGGSADGVQALADAVRRLKKPSLAYVDGQMSGSAYVAFSGAREVIACDSTAMFGGVGVIISFADLRGSLEKKGVKFHDILSSLSPDKNKELFDVRKGNYDTLRKNQLDPLAEIFINYVKVNRREAYGPKWKTGKSFFAGEALSLGLIDGVGSIQEALEALKAMA